MFTPVITEKSINGQERSKYTFLVPLDANKIEVQKGIEKLYGVKVDNVRVINVKAKTRLIGRGRLANKRADQKKVIVTIAKKGNLDITKIKGKS